MIEDFGHDAAVGVVPAGDAGVVAGVDGVLKDGLVLAEGCPLAGGGIFEREQEAAGGDVDCRRRDTGEEGGDDVAGVFAGGDDVSEDGGLRGEAIEGGEFEAGEAAFVELLVGELVEQQPDDAAMRRRRSALCLVERGRSIEVAGLPAAPDQLREDEQAGEREETQDGGGGVLNLFKAREKSSPEEGNCDQYGKADAGDEVGEPVGNFSAGEVGDGVEKDRWQGEEEGGPDDDAESSGPFRQVKQRSQQKGEREDVDDDRNDDGRGRTNEMVDEVVIGGDERAGEVEQIQVRETEGDCGRMGERPHSLFSFNAR